MSRSGSLSPPLGVRPWHAFVAQTRWEVRLALRRTENLLVTFAVPILLLVVFSAVPLLPVGMRPGVQFVGALESLVPAVLAVAVISTGLVALGISTAYERSYGVLKRLLGSPLPRWALLAAKVVVVGATLLIQVLLVGAVATVLGWKPPSGAVAALLAALPWLLLGTICFSALGLLLAGRLRPESVLAVANGLFLVLLLLGGVLIPLGALPAILAGPASLLPSALLAELLRGTMQPGGAVDPLQAAGLGAWSIGLAAAAVAWFRVD